MSIDYIIKGDGLLIYELTLLELKNQGFVKETGSFWKKLSMNKIIRLLRMCVNQDYFIKPVKGKMSKND